MATPFMPQMEAAECGAACLGMVLGHFGHHADLAEARTACGVSRDGTSAGAIVRAARSYGLEVKATRVEPPALANTAVPAILHWGFTHFVVLTRASRHGVYLLDPAVGARFAPWAEVDRLFTGVRLTFGRTPTFRKRKRRSLGVGRYVAVVRQAIPNMALVLVATAALELVGLISPILTQVAIDFVIRPRQGRFLPWLFGLLLLSVALRFVLAIARENIATALRMGLDWRLRMDFVRHLISLPLSFFSKRGSGDLAGRAAGHDKIRDVVQSLSMAGLDALLVASYLGLMLAYDCQLGLTVVLLTVLKLGLVAASQSALRQPVAGEVVATANEAATIDETFCSSETLQSLGVQDAAIRRFLDFLTLRSNKAAERRVVELRFVQLAPLFECISLATVYLVGGQRVATDQMTIGVLAAFVAMTALLTRPLSALADALSALPSLRATARRLGDVWATAPDPTGSLTPPALGGRISLRDLTLAYGGSSVCAVAGVTLDIAPGERVAIVGASGCGKSSVASLIAGLEQPSHGHVYLDEHDLRTLDRCFVQRHVGVVFADSLYFAGTIRENLELGTPRILDELVRATTIAGIHSEIQRLPDGYDTILDAAGGPLSGGQRQRVALARALLGKPRILILDEATSSLDVELEKSIMTRLRGCGVTQIIISHRQSAIRLADRIVVMASGQVVDQGSLDELLLRCPTFRGVFQSTNKGGQ